MQSIQAILTLDMENLPANFQDILKHEQAVVAEWKEEGILEHLFLRETKNGAVLIFKGMDLEEAQARMQTLPFFALKKSVEYLSLIKQFWVYNSVCLTRRFAYLVELIALYAPLRLIHFTPIFDRKIIH